MARAKGRVRRPPMSVLWQSRRATRQFGVDPARPWPGSARQFRVVLPEPSTAGAGLVFSSAAQSVQLQPPQARLATSSAREAIHSRPVQCIPDRRQSTPNRWQSTPDRRLPGAFVSGGWPATRPRAFSDGGHARRPMFTERASFASPLFSSVPRPVSVGCRGRVSTAA